MSQPPEDPAVPGVHPEPMDRPENRAGTGGRGIARRTMLLAGLGALAGCASQGGSRKLPGAIWPQNRTLSDSGTSIPPRPAPASPGTLPGIIPRDRWSRADLIPSRATRMTPCRHITIHHDGMRPFYGTTTAQVAVQIEKIRSMHVGNNHWADIGYHFVVDRAGRAWEARPIGWQGAHVKDQNVGNIGVLCLGNFEEQQPTSQQLDGLRVLVLTLSSRYRIPSGNILTHQEWSTARTLCPGENLQGRIVQMRRAGMLA